MTSEEKKLRLQEKEKAEQDRIKKHNAKLERKRLVKIERMEKKYIDRHVRGPVYCDNGTKWVGGKVVDVVLDDNDNFLLEIMVGKDVVRVRQDKSLLA